MMILHDKTFLSVYKTISSVCTFHQTYSWFSMIIYLVCIFEWRNVYLKAIRALPGRIIAPRSIGPMRNYRPEIARWGVLRIEAHAGSAANCERATNRARAWSSCDYYFLYRPLLRHARVKLPIGEQLHRQLPAQERAVSSSDSLYVRHKRGSEARILNIKIERIHNFFFHGSLYRRIK